MGVIETCKKIDESVSKNEKCCPDFQNYKSKCVKPCQVKGHKMTTACCPGLVRNKNKFCDTQYCIREGRPANSDKQKCCGNLQIISGRCTYISGSLSGLSANKEVKKKESKDPG